MRLDINAFLGGYPWRDIGRWTPSRLLDAMDRTKIDEAWVGQLDAIAWRDPAAGNAALYELTAAYPRLHPVPAIHPGLPRFGATLAEARLAGVPAVRCDPTWYGLSPTGGEMLALAAACAELDLPLMLAVRFEDGRQRHPHDGAAELAPWAIRTLIRSHPALRLIITHADRECIEQVHFGATPDEAARLLWDLCWIWGPPEDHLALLLRTIGAERFAFGTGMPLRIPENSVAKLDLLEMPASVRQELESGNALRFVK